MVEMSGLAPGPFCGMILSDFGAKVVRVDKVSALVLCIFSFTPSTVNLTFSCYRQAFSKHFQKHNSFNI